MRRLLRVIPSLNPVLGGTVQAVLGSVEPLRRLGVDTHVVCGDAPDSPWIAQHDCPIHAIGSSTAGYGYSPGWGRWLKQNLDGYDVLLIDGLWQYAGLIAAKLAARAQIPYYVFAHGMLDPWFNKFPLKRIKKILYWRLFQERVLAEAGGVIFTCEIEAQLARTSFSPYLVRELLAPLGVAAPKLMEIADYPRLHGDAISIAEKPYLLYFGRVHEKKGCDLLIEAFARAGAAEQGMRLVIAGPADPDLKKSLMGLANRLGIQPAVEWLGMVSGNAKWDVLRSADAFCLASHQENFGISVVEAMACGSAVIISDKVNIHPTIDAAGAGLVCTDTLDSVTGAIEKWLEMTPQDKQRYRANALAAYEENFTSDRAAAALVEAIGLK